MLTIKGWITRAAQRDELVAGRPGQQAREYTTDDGDVIRRALEIGAQVNEAGAVYLTYKQIGVVSYGGDGWPRVPTDAADAVALCEEWYTAKMQAEEAERAEKDAARLAREAEVRESFERDGVSALVRKNDGLYGRSGGGVTRYCAVGSCRHEEFWRDWYVVDDVPADLRDAAKSEADRRTEEEHAAAVARLEAHELEHRVKIEAEARRVTMRLALLAQLAGRLGDASAKTRLTQPGPTPLGLLPEAEAETIVRDALLPVAPDLRLAEYRKITKREVQKTCVGDREDDYDGLHRDVVFAALDADDEEAGGLTAAEWATVQQIETALGERGPHLLYLVDGLPFTVELKRRVHRGQCREHDCPVWPIRRVGVRVRITIDGVLVVEREYGAAE